MASWKHQFADLPNLSGVKEVQRGDGHHQAVTRNLDLGEVRETEEIG